MGLLLQSARRRLCVCGHCARCYTLLLLVFLFSSFLSLLFLNENVLCVILSTLANHDDNDDDFALVKIVIRSVCSLAAKPATFNPTLYLLMIQATDMDSHFASNYFLPATWFYEATSLPSLSSSSFTNSPALTSSVLPYTTLLRPRSLLVRSTHSCRLPYSSMLPPPTVNTTASVNP